MTVISISNIKGGVAKTTTAATLAAGLNNKGYSVLMIDSDPQMNLTMCFRSEPEEGTPSLYGLYEHNGEKDLYDICQTLKIGLDLIPGDFDLCSADLEFFRKPGSLKILRKFLKSINEHYDYVIIDTPPNLGFLSLNAFMASDYIVTPMATDSFSLRAIRLLKSTLSEIESEAERKIPVLGVLLTRYQKDTIISKELEAHVVLAASLLDTTLFNSRIRQATVVQQSQIAKMDLFQYDPKAKVTHDYQNFVDEFLERIKQHGC